MPPPNGPNPGVENPSWAPVISIVDLGRILMLLHGANAPSMATLKKWSASGEFRNCLLTADDAFGGRTDPAGTEREGTSPRARPGRPGLRLSTDRAIARVYELWPQLVESSSPAAVFEQAVARTADQLVAAIRPLIHDASSTSQTPRVEHPRLGAPHQSASQEWQQRIEEAVSLLGRDMRELRREMAQFTALRNNLITRLDEVVARSRESLLAGPRAEAGTDPIVEARRDRDMGVLKSTIDQIRSTLERIETSNRGSR